MDDAIRITERVFGLLSSKKCILPPKIYLFLPFFGGDFRAMPAYLGDGKSCGIKWVCAYPNNPSRHLPAVMATVILNNPKNGRPLAIFEGGTLTALRTGAAGAVAAKYLARKNSKVLALVGCGVQAEYQLKALERLFSFKEIFVWGFRRHEAEKFVRRLTLKTRPFCVARTVRDCVTSADIVCTTTPSRRALVQRSWIKEGAHINAIGADAEGKQELDFRLLKEARVVVDDEEQALHSGEINKAVSRGLFHRRDITATLGDVVSGKKRGRLKESDITLFDSTGLAVQDIAVASELYYSK